MAEIINPHDKFFKEMLAQPEAARIVLRDFLPSAVAGELDLSCPQLVKDSFIDEVLQEHFSDLVYEVALRDHGSAFVCVLFEHKSYVDSMTPLQVLRCMVHGWEYSLRQRNWLWPVIPVVIYHGAARWTAATNFQAWFELPEAFGVYVPEFQYLLTDLYVMSAGGNISMEDVRTAIKSVAPEGDAMIGTIAQEWLQQGEQAWAAPWADCRHPAGAEAQVWAGWRCPDAGDCAD